MTIDRSKLFLDALERRVLIFDGAMGTSIHALDLTLADFNNLENCSEVLNLTRPDAIEQIHRDFLAVGCDAVETNTFGGMPHVLVEFGLEDRCYEINVAAAQIARRAADAFSTPEQPRFAIGSIGPGTKLITLRQIDYEAMLASYSEQIRGLLDGGVDVLLIETCQDLLQTKVAIEAARRSFDRLGRRVPLMCQVTMETTGAMLVGTDIAAAVAAIETYPEVDVLGLNCATGPQEMSPHIRYLAANCSRKLSVLPNAGLPQLVEGRTHFPLTPAELARWLREFVQSDGVNVVGGCCGTTPEHLRAVVQALRGGEAVAAGPRKPIDEPACTSLYAAVPYRQDNSFLIVGERCNTNGSRQFKRLLADGDLDALVQMGIEQVREEGAHVLDVCVDYVGRDGVPDMHNVVERFAREVNAPLMLDSTEPPVIEAGLRLAGGKCIVNSVNLEDGEHRMAQICRMLRQYGAGVVALTIDEHPTEAMAKSAERKLQIALRIHELLTRKYGIREEDIFFDCLTFPITTGSEADRRLGLETLDGIERVMKALPRCQSILGLSNISFGLAPAARVVLNSAFLSEARQRGLTAAIVHAAKILPRTQISDERWEAALDLIYDRQEKGDPLSRFIGLFSDGEQLATKKKLADLPIEERLRQRIIDGNRVGLEADLEEARARYSPLDIVNNLLLDGMRVVGELFGAGQMQLPFVLKSAEAMKAAVAALEPFMEKAGGGSRGKIVLATVRGDVHDIGKNLVDIILSNNGYTVYNLGIKQPISNIITALREHGADAIGLSGLLVKSTLVMRDDLHILNEQGISVPVILGGAALTRRYVEEDLRSIYKGPLFYAGDAFEGLHLMGEITGATSSATTTTAALAAAAGAGSVATLAEPVSVEATPSSGRQQRAAAAFAAERARVSARSAETLERELEQRYGLKEIEDDDVPSGGDDGAWRDSAPPAAREAGAARSNIGHEHPVPQPPFWGARTIETLPLRAVLAYLNEVMLFQVQWGYRKKGRSSDEFKRYIDREVRPVYRELVERCDREQIIRPQAVYGYWPCNSDGDELVVYAPPAGGERLPLRELTRSVFRVSGSAALVSERFLAAARAGVADVVAFHIVTAGRRVSDVAREWFAANDYQQYLFLHGLGVETAEAAAEYMHKQIRMELGVAQRDARDISRLFQQGYQGSRYSFGYPACPRLEDQAGIMKLLNPERIGITLSEEWQLDPEQSTSAIVAYHPDARYFNVR